MFLFPHWDWCLPLQPALINSRKHLECPRHKPNSSNRVFFFLRNHAGQFVALIGDMSFCSITVNNRLLLALAARPGPRTPIPFSSSSVFFTLHPSSLSLTAFLSPLPWKKKLKSWYSKMRDFSFCELVEKPPSNMCILFFNLKVLQFDPCWRACWDFVNTFLSLSFVAFRCSYSQSAASI